MKRLTSTNNTSWLEYEPPDIAADSATISILYGVKMPKSFISRVQMKAIVGQNDNDI